MPAYLLAVLTAYYLDGLTEGEIAKRLGITRQQVRTRHKQGIELLWQLR